MPMFKSFFLSAKMNPGPSMAPVVTELGSAVSLKQGDSGKALSILRPSGRAKIGEGVFDVTTNGEFIEADAAVKVLAISGPNIVVGRAG
jgi:membrane-bound ClpP family serine protease